MEPARPIRYTEPDRSLPKRALAWLTRTVPLGTAPNPVKAANERFVLGYTVVWGTVIGALMLSGQVRKLGDIGLLAVGLGLWLPLPVRAVLWPSNVERHLRWHQRYATKIQVWMILFSFLGNWFGTRYFYEVLGMHYGFNSTWNPNHVPLFLYFLTIAYFSTYATLANVVRRALAGFGLPRWLAWALIAFALAALETTLNATPLMRGLFCYDRLDYALGFGTVLYGVWFMIAGPLWFQIDEQPGLETPWLLVLGSVLAAFMLILVAMELFENVLATLGAPVHYGAIGLQDFGASCLSRT